MSFSDNERQRYARHILLKEIGGPGQQRLKAATVAIVGAGGLGAPAALYLAAAGVGRLRLIDHDAVTLDNLQRQIIFRAADIGMAKVERAKAALAALNDQVDVEIERQQLTESNAAYLLRGADVVLDGTDDFATRFAVNAAARALGAPIVSGAVGRWDGQVAVFAPSGPCYRCFVPEAPPNAATCERDGIVGALTGVIGSMMALEAIKLIAHAGEPLIGRILFSMASPLRRASQHSRAIPPARSAAMNEAWAEQLIAAARLDFETRTRLAQSGALFGGYHPEMEAVHDANAALLSRVLDAVGWPGRHIIGDEAARAAFVIVQHAIGHPDLQRRSLALMLDAIPEGQANALDAAYLADRIAVFEGGEQTFGTQFDWDASGQLSPAPIRDGASVDERRASVGLPSMAETIAHMRANAAAEGETAPADLAQRRADFEVWARRAGWRA